jgi:hypothetical protein
MRFTNFNVEPECTPPAGAHDRPHAGPATGARPALASRARAPEITLAEMSPTPARPPSEVAFGDEPGRNPTDQGFEEAFSHNSASYQDRVGLTAVAKVPHFEERGWSPGRAQHIENRPDRRADRREVDVSSASTPGEGPSSLFVSGFVHHPYSH